MRRLWILSVLITTGLLRAQDGQHASRPNWPCVAGRAVDPTYLDISESTGGQLFLFQKGEAAQSGLVMNAPYTHPVTVLRAVGHLNGTRDLEFPVDSSIESLLLLVSVQCRNAILVSRPSGAEATDRNSALSVELAAGKILRVDQPEPGKWRVRLTGSGLFVLSVMAKSTIALSAVSFSRKDAQTEGDEPAPRSNIPMLGAPQTVNLRIGGSVSRLTAQLVDASLRPIADLDSPEQVAEGAYRTTVATEAERYRILVTGEDGSSWPFQRMYPVLFHAKPAK